jgi:hypothetical protein
VLNNSFCEREVYTRMGLFDVIFHHSPLGTGIITEITSIALMSSQTFKGRERIIGNGRERALDVKLLDDPVQFLLVYPELGILVFFCQVIGQGVGQNSILTSLTDKGMKDSVDRKAQGGQIGILSQLGPIFHVLLFLTLLLWLWWMLCL